MESLRGLLAAPLIIALLGGLFHSFGVFDTVLAREAKLAGRPQPATPLLTAPAAPAATAPRASAPAASASPISVPFAPPSTPPIPVAPSTAGAAPTPARPAPAALPPLPNAAALPEGELGEGEGEPDLSAVEPEVVVQPSSSDAQELINQELQAAQAAAASAEQIMEVQPEEGLEQEQ